MGLTNGLNQVIVGMPGLDRSINVAGVPDEKLIELGGAGRIATVNVIACDRRRAVLPGQTDGM